jgi:hypothetical protein
MIELQVKCDWSNSYSFCCDILEEKGSKSGSEGRNLIEIISDFLVNSTKILGQGHECFFPNSLTLFSNRRLFDTCKLDVLTVSSNKPILNKSILHYCLNADYSMWWEDSYEWCAGTDSKRGDRSIFLRNSLGETKEKHNILNQDGGSVGIFELYNSDIHV